MNKSNETRYSKVQIENLNNQKDVLIKFSDRFKREPQIFSIDEKGHPLFISSKISDGYKDTPAEKEVYAYVLGVNEKGLLKSVLVGQMLVLKLKKHVEIKSMEVAEEYQGIGIGKILTQVAENYAVDNDINKIKLYSLLNKTPLDLPNSSGEFDKNLYFYYSQGFKKCFASKNTITKKVAIPMLKTGLQKLNVTYGLYSTRDFNVEDKKFRPSKIYSQELAKQPFTTVYLSDEDKLVKPLVLSKDVDNTSALHYTIINDIMESRKEGIEQ